MKPRVSRRSADGTTLGPPSPASRIEQRNGTRTCDSSCGDSDSDSPHADVKARRAQAPPRSPVRTSASGSGGGSGGLASNGEAAAAAAAAAAARGPAAGSILQQQQQQQGGGSGMPAAAAPSRRRLSDDDAQHEDRDKGFVAPHAPAAAAPTPAAAARPAPWCLSDFEVGKQIGQGKFGSVFLAKERSSAFEVALKVLSKPHMISASFERQLWREIHIHGSLRHPNILRLYGSFADAHKVYLILEHAPGGELHSALRAAGAFDEARAAGVVLQLSRALRHCHVRGVWHRDCKLENVLLGGGGELKLADFGWAVRAEPGARRRTLCGTVDYLCPEMVEGRAHNAKVDNWALGVVAFELLTGRAPFSEPDEARTFARIARADVRFGGDRDSVGGAGAGGVSAAAKEFVRRLLVKDPAKRMELEEVERHPWVRANADPLLLAAEPCL